MLQNYVGLVALLSFEFVFLILGVKIDLKSLKKYKTLG